MSTPAETPYADARPLFILGCVRSGTTLTRDLLRRVPNFICPEETHMYRWTEPFRTPASLTAYRKNKILQGHRELDGVDEQDYQDLLETCRTKAELQRGYITLFAKAHGITEPYRWFDKSPQNIYGAPLIAHEFPRARFLHLVRNPLNVVGSLTSGRQMKVPDIQGACNYWIEAVSIAKTVQRAYPNRFLELRYEDLVADVPAAMGKILDHVKLQAPDGLYSKSDARAEKNLWREDLDEKQVRIVVRRCGDLAAEKGYDLAKDAASQLEKTNSQA